MLYIYNGATAYLYLKNLLGDVTALVSDSGEIVMTYTYDAWGAVSYSVSTMQNMQLAVSLYNVNPFTYRGYCYDDDIGMYYLQSRYYDPQICRFINADSTDYLGATGTVLSYNLFAYCENDAVNWLDSFGFFKAKDHKDITYSVAINYFSEVIATGLAEASEKVDEWYPPVKEFYSRYSQSFHFNVNSTMTWKEDSRDTRSKEFIKLGIDALKSAQKETLDISRAFYLSLSVLYFGIAIHPIQDKVAHSGFGGNNFTLICIGNGIWVSFYWHLPNGIDDVNATYLKTGKTKGAVAKNKTRDLIKKYVRYYKKYGVYDSVKK